MRPTLLLFLLLLTTSMAVAQPILGPATLPTPVRSEEFLFADTAGISPGGGGVGVVWDFTMLRARMEDPTTQVQQTVRPETLPQEVRDQFPNADRAIVRDTLTELFQQRGFFLRMIGMVTPSATVRVAESDPYDVRPVELRFNVEHRDTHTATITPSGLPLQIPRGGTYRIVYDGWGRLLLPGTPSLQVARATSRLVTTDTLRFGPETRVVTTELDRTTWVDATSDRQFLVMETERISQVVNDVPLPDTTVSRQIRYLEANTVSVDEADHSATLRIRPHPITDASFTVEGLSAMPTAARLVTLDGDVVALEGGLTVLTDQAVVLLPEVAPGLYLLELDVVAPTGGRRTIRQAVVIMR